MFGKLLSIRQTIYLRIEKNTYNLMGVVMRRYDTDFGHAF